MSVLLLEVNTKYKKVIHLFSYNLLRVTEREPIPAALAVRPGMSCPGYVPGMSSR